MQKQTLWGLFGFISGWLLEVAFFFIVIYYIYNEFFPLRLPWVFYMLIMFPIFPYKRAISYYRGEPIKLGWSLGWITVSSKADPLKRKLALFFDSFFWLIAIIIASLVYYFAEK